MLSRRRGITLTELLAVIGILAVLAGIGYRVGAPAREKGRESVCRGRLRQMHVAATMYSDDHQATSEFPELPGGSLRGYAEPALLWPYLGSSKEFRNCPSAPPCARWSFATYQPNVIFDEGLKSTPHLRNTMRQQADWMKDAGENYPVVLCSMHTAYHAVSDGPHSALSDPPYTVELLASGAVRSGPRSYGMDFAKFLCEKRR